MHAHDLIDQDQPDESDYRRETEHEAQGRRWAAWLEDNPDLTDAERDVAAWAFRDAWGAGATFGIEWAKSLTSSATPDYDLFEARATAAALLVDNATLREQVRMLSDRLRESADSETGEQR